MTGPICIPASDPSVATPDIRAGAEGVPENWFHPLYFDAIEATHSRPAMPVVAPAVINHVVFHSGEHAAPHAIDSFMEIALAHGFEIVRRGQSEIMLATGDVKLKWERHTEFISITLIAQGADAAAIGASAGSEAQSGTGKVGSCMAHLLKGLMQADNHGRLLARQCILLDRVDDPQTLDHAVQVDEVAHTGPPIRIHINGGAQRLETDLLHDEQGVVVYRLHDLANSRADRLGRLVQRLMEIETYRILAYLAAPLLQEVGLRLSQLGLSIDTIAQRCAERPDSAEEAQILEQLTALSAELQHVTAIAGFRFAASSAYANLVTSRLGELREQRVEGFQRLSNAITRRMDPLIRSCQALQRRLDANAARISHITELLRTRVDLVLQDQNAAVLKSIDDRARTQLRLQETVEGLSVAAISYYVLGILGYLLKGLDKGFGTILGGVHAEAVLALLVLPVLAVVFMGGRLIRHQAHKDQ